MNNENVMSKMPYEEDQIQPEMKSSRNHRPLPYQTYKIRYFHLIIFIMLSMSNSFQWIEYAIIDELIKTYYQISTFWLNCTSVVYMFTYLIGIVPATYFLDRYGLRLALLIGSFGNALGSWIKLFSVQKDRFWLAMLGQTITACSQLFILEIPPFLSAVWFPAAEVASSTAYGVFGNQVGIGLGFLIPPLIMSIENASKTTSDLKLTSRQIDLIGERLFDLSLMLAIITTIIFLVIYFAFQDRPEHPPSEAQALIRNLKIDNCKQSYWERIGFLFKNRNFILLFISYGLITGVFYGLSVVLGQMIGNVMGEQYIVEAGSMGLAITLSGIVGSLVCGWILNWTGEYKLVTAVVYLCSMLGTTAFTIAILGKSIQWLMFTCILMGFFMTGYLPIGFEFAAEVCYPQPEGTSAGLLNASAQFFGIIFTYTSSPIIEKFGAAWTNVVYVIILAIGAILTMLVSNDLRRQRRRIV